MDVGSQEGTEPPERLPPGAARGSRALWQSVFLSSLGISFLVFGLPIYGKMMGAGALEIGGLFSAFSATIVVGRPLVGWALDHLGRKRFFVAASACYALSMLLVSSARGLTELYVSQLVRGIGSSLLWISAYTIATDLAPREERGRAVGRVDEASNRAQLYGAVTGMAVMGFLGLRMDVAWRTLLVGYALFGAVGVLVAWRGVPETLPSCPARVTASRRAMSGRLARFLLVVFVTGASSAMVTPILLVFLQDRFRMDLRLLILVFVPAGLAAGFLPSRLGRLSDRLGRVPLIAVGLGISGLAFLLLPLPDSFAWVILLWVLQTIGAVMAGPAQEAMVSDLTGEHVRGTGYGLYSLAANLGSVFGPLAGGWLYDAVGHGAPFYLNGVVLVAGGAWVLAMLGERPLVRGEPDRVMPH